MDEMGQLSSFFTEIVSRMLKLEERAVTRGFGQQLSLTEMHIIEKIGEREPSRMTEIACALGVTMATLTVACDRLEQKGFVRRARDARDRRVVNLSLTDTGHAAFAFHRAYQASMMDALLEELTSEQATALAQSLETLKRLVQQQEQDEKEATHE